MFLVGAALVSAIVPVPQAAVERGYSLFLYPRIQFVMTTASNLVPFAWLDVLLIAGLAAWIGLFVRDLRAQTGLAATGRALLRGVVWLSAVYLAFLSLWGLNYRRVPLAEKLVTERNDLQSAARRVARLTVIRVNALHSASAANRSQTLDPELSEGIAAAVADLHLHPPVVGRPKRTVLNFYFKRAGVDGMTDPFFLETLVADDVLPFERPFVVAHEWSHLAGIADEGDANFVGWQACLRGSPADQYSGWLFLFGELMRAVGRSDREALQAALDPGPRSDLRAIRDRLARQVNPRVSVAGWRVYDSYLKANRVEAGSASYFGVVQLVLTTEFQGDWHPVLKP